MARGQRGTRGKVVPIKEPEQTFQEDPERPRDGDEEEADETAANGHNARLAAIDAGHDAHLKLQAEEDRLLDKYIVPIRKKKAKIKADLKSEYDVPTDAFNARQAMLAIERRGDDFMVAALNEQFQATPIGKNMDMGAVLVRAAAIRKERADAKAEKEAAKSKATHTPMEA